MFFFPTVFKAISTASRASLISDAFSLAEASEISQSKAFDMTTYLKEERDFVPWYAVDGALSNTEKNLQRKGAFGNFQVRQKATIYKLFILKTLRESYVKLSSPSDDFHFASGSNIIVFVLTCAGRLVRFLWSGHFWI